MQPHAAGYGSTPDQHWQMQRLRNMEANERALDALGLLDILGLTAPSDLDPDPPRPFHRRVYFKDPERVAGLRTRAPLHGERCKGVAAAAWHVEPTYRARRRNGGAERATDER